MSRQNKVNPGQYTQRGRLTQDDAARELRQQRSIGSQHTWQPVQKDQMPRPRVGLKDNDADRDTDPTGDATRATTPKKAAPTQPKAKQSTTAKPKTAKKTTGKAKSAKAAKPAAKRAAPKTTRKAVLARNVGGGGSQPRKAAKRRKS